MVASVERPLPVTHGVEPLRGWRWVRTVEVDGRISAASIIDHLRYDRSEAHACPVLFGPEGDAVCQRLTHPAPAPGCRCGFWSVPRVTMLDDAVGERLAGWALAEVELSGTVIEAERGMRSAHQRILSLTFPDRCERPGCHERTTGLATTPEGFLHSACADHDGVLALAEAAGRLGTEARFGVLATARSPIDCRPWAGPAGGSGLTFLAAVAGASSVGAVAANSGSSAAAGAAVLLAVVIGGLTGLGAALRTLARRPGRPRRPAFEVLATLTALMCMAVSVTAVIATTTPPVH